MSDESETPPTPVPPPFKGSLEEYKQKLELHRKLGLKASPLRSLENERQFADEEPPPDLGDSQG